MTYKELIQSLLNSHVNGAKFMGQDIEFYVHEDEGEYKAKIGKTQHNKGKYLIHCTLIDESTTPVPVEGLNAFEKAESLEIAVPVDLTCIDADTGIYTGGVDYVRYVLESFTFDSIGLTDTITVGNAEYSCVLKISRPSYGSEIMIAGIGRVIPVSINLDWQVFEGVLGNNLQFWVSVHGENKYEKAVIVDGSVIRTKVGDPAQYADEDDSPLKDEMKTAIEQQGLTLKLQIPFKRNGVSKELAKDMWQSQIDKIYDIKIVDSAVYEDLDHALVLPMLTKEITMPTTPGAFLALNTQFVIALADEDEEE